jgi:hypothetical protein
MTGASMEEIMAVLNGMGDNDGVIIKKTGDDLDVDKISFQDEDMMESLEESDDDDDDDQQDESMDEEIVYEIELGEEDDDDDSTVTEASMMVKPKGLGMGKAKSELPTGKVNMKGFKEDMSQHKESFKGPKKFEFKEGEDADVETKETETKEAARTLGNGSRNFPKRKGLPKMKVITNSALQEEVEKLKGPSERDLVYSGLEEIMCSAVKENWDFAIKKNLSFRDACLVNAIHKVYKSYKENGIMI